MHAEQALQEHLRELQEQTRKATQSPDDDGAASVSSLGSSSSGDEDREMKANGARAETGDVIHGRRHRTPMLEHDLLKLESGRHGSCLLLSLRQTRMDTSQPNRRAMANAGRCVTWARDPGRQRQQQWWTRRPDEPEGHVRKEGVRTQLTFCVMYLSMHLRTLVCRSPRHA